ncbi:hypothetical protein IFT84_17715 [Rhizobium sp. CFBP 8762]|uniref:phage protease n=1 Tax=Rhizobium sp. CFBP 8762 TaxID=2775279 RepID=UPI0017811CCF|nr:phage protease [Rhizobium sp. CFBP 8762]MBD8556349.1 hypothetical protein [Rhizobium sp. CFBP 8762]
MKPSLTCTLSSELPELKAGGKVQTVQLTPSGEGLARDGRRFIFDNLEQIVARSLEYAGTTEPVIDFDHQTERAKENGKPAPAAGWIKAFEVRSSGIWATVEWTEAAAQMIEKRHYRYISPVIKTTRDGRVELIAHAGLVNNPALDMAALASTEEGTHDMLPKALLTALELDDAAELDDVIAAILAMKTAIANRTKEEQLSSVFSELATNLAKERLELHGERQAAKVEEAIRQGVIPPAMRDWGLQLASTDEASFDTFCTKVGKPLAHLFTPAIREETLATITRNDPYSVALKSEAANVARNLGLDAVHLIDGTK